MFGANEGQPWGRPEPDETKDGGRRVGTTWSNEQMNIHERWEQRLESDTILVWGFEGIQFFLSDANELWLLTIDIKRIDWGCCCLCFPPIASRYTKRKKRKVVRTHQGCRCFQQACRCYCKSISRWRSGKRGVVRCHSHVRICRMPFFSRQHQRPVC